MKVSLVLGGGGIKGLAHIGVLQALAEHDIGIESMSGVSAGAVVGAGYAAWAGNLYPAEIAFKLRRQALKTDYSKFKDWKWGPGLFSGNNLHEFLLEQTGGRTFGESGFPFICTAVDYETGKTIYFSPGTTPDIRLADAARASGSLPEIFAPFKLRVLGRERQLWDGGITGTIRPDLVSHDVPVVIVSLGGEAPVEPVIHRAPFYLLGPYYLAWIALRVITIGIDEMDARLLENVTDAIVVSPDTLGIGTTDFGIDLNKKATLIDSGKRAMCNALVKLEALTL